MYICTCREIVVVVVAAVAVVLVVVVSSEHSVLDVETVVFWN